MSVFVDFLDTLPKRNAIAVGHMLHRLSEDDAGFIEDYLISGAAIPGNIIARINQAFKDSGYPQMTWETCQIDTSGMRFDGWLDEIE